MCAIFIVSVKCAKRSLENGMFSGSFQYFSVPFAQSYLITVLIKLLPMATKKDGKSF